MLQNMNVINQVGNISDPLGINSRRPGTAAFDFR